MPPAVDDQDCSGASSPLTRSRKRFGKVWILFPLGIMTSPTFSTRHFPMLKAPSLQTPNHLPPSLQLPQSEPRASASAAYGWTQPDRKWDWVEEVDGSV